RSLELRDVRLQTTYAEAHSLGLQLSDLDAELATGKVFLFRLHKLLATVTRAEQKSAQVNAHGALRMAPRISGRLALEIQVGAPGLIQARGAYEEMRGNDAKLATRMSLRGISAQTFSALGFEDLAAKIQGEVGG